MLSRSLCSLRSARRSITSAAFCPAFKDIDANALQLHKTKRPKEHLDSDKLKFGATFSDHMLEVDWENGLGWSAPKISPYHALELDPANSTLHYGLDCFEGFKVHRGVDDKLRLFRPELYMDRLEASMKRLCFPSFNQGELLKCIKEAIKIDAAWVPKELGSFLYVRPNAISTHSFIGVGQANSVKIYCIFSPSPAAWKDDQLSPINAIADLSHARSTSGGFGGYKIGSNYSVSLNPTIAAQASGYEQILWLSGIDNSVCQLGNMNVFFLIKSKSGEVELVTPKLNGTVVKGVTRDSVISMVNKHGKMKVREDHISLKDISQAFDENRMIEIFGTESESLITPVKNIRIGEKSYKINPTYPMSKPLYETLYNDLTDIQYGRKAHEWATVL